MVRMSLLLPYGKLIKMKKSKRYEVDPIIGMRTLTVL